MAGLKESKDPALELPEDNPVSLGRSRQIGVLLEKLAEFQSCRMRR